MERQAISLLLVDGDDQKRNNSTEWLQRSSPEYVIRQAASATTALEILRSTSIDCVVLELDLPDRSGFEVLGDLVPIATRHPLAVIVLTQLTNQSLLKAALKNGAHAVLQKTMTSGDALDKTIREAVATVRRETKNALGSGVSAP